MLIESHNILNKVHLLKILTVSLFNSLAWHFLKYSRFWMQQINNYDSKASKVCNFILKQLIASGRTCLFISNDN